MSRAIIRPLWGDFSLQDGFATNRSLILKTIDLVLNDKYTTPFWVYVCGEDNYRFLTETKKLTNVIMVSKDSTLRSPKHCYLNRLDICKVAIKHFDEIVCLNWNCRLVKPFDMGFWDALGKKEAIQAPLIKSRINLLTSRNGKENKIFPNDSFLYFRCEDEINNVMAINKLSGIPNDWTSESLIAHYLDNKHGGWIGVEKYAELYEPDVVNIDRVGMVMKQNPFFITNKIFKTEKIR